jgi:hypothetical protein
MVTSASHRPEVTTLDLQSALARLQSVKPAQHMLSAYLDTSPARITGSAYLLAYRDGLKSTRPRFSDSEADAFEAAAARVEEYLTKEFVPHARGLAAFAYASAQKLLVVPLPCPPLVEHVTWDVGPEIGPLEAMLDEYERIAVALFDTQRARLLTVFLGAIESEQSLEDYVPGKQATGGWFGLEQTRFERHREDHLRRHAEHAVKALMSLLRTHSFDHLLIGGPDEPLAVLRHHLPRPLRARLAGTLDLELFASDANVLAATMHAADAIERQADLRLVDELLDAASTPHVVLGIAGALDALAEGRVHVLILAQDYADSGACCSTCGRLVSEGHPCPSCGVPAAPVANLHEVVVQQALAQGGRVEIVGGPAAARLREHGGIGAWTRF